MFGLQPGYLQEGEENANDGEESNGINRSTALPCSTRSAGQSGRAHVSDGTILQGFGYLLATGCKLPTGHRVSENSCVPPACTKNTA